MNIRRGLFRLWLVTASGWAIVVTGLSLTLGGGVDDLRVAFGQNDLSVEGDCGAITLSPWDTDESRLGKIDAAAKILAPTIEALQTDGTILEFPDGTADAVIDRVESEHARAMSEQDDDARRVAESAKWLRANETRRGTPEYDRVGAYFKAARERQLLLQQSFDIKKPFDKVAPQEDAGAMSGKNPFDQFDKPPPRVAPNPFDQFDAQPQAAPKPEPQSTGKPWEKYAKKAAQPAIPTVAEPSPPSVSENPYAQFAKKAEPNPFAQFVKTPNRFVKYREGIDPRKCATARVSLDSWRSHYQVTYEAARTVRKAAVAKVRESFLGFALILVLPPLLIFAIGSAIVWALAGFASPRSSLPPDAN